MASDYEPVRPIRKVIPVTLMLLILGIFFAIYFFKYIPEQQNSLNDRGFLELQQIQNAVRNKEAGYANAIRVFLLDTKAGSRLRSSFSALPYWPSSDSNRSYSKVTTAITKDPDRSSMLLTYHLVGYQANDRNKDSGFYLTIPLEKVLSPIITTYKDIFENYLLIQDSSVNFLQLDSMLACHLNGDPACRPRNNSQLTSPHRGEILYNSGSVPIDYPVEMDSLIKIRDGFSFLNVHNVTVQGNSYKLFLYPLRLGSQQIILAGLVSISRYNQSVRAIPFILIALPIIFVVLLLIHLPVLKIFLLGKYERVTDTDIRLLIGSYFAAAFAAFFLFSWIFLGKAQVENNRKNLTSLSNKIREAFGSEVDSICLQLIRTDSLYATKIAANPASLDPMRRGSRQDSTHLDSLFHPDIYRYADNIFLVDSTTSRLIAIWSATRAAGKPNLFPVRDRQYYKDFISQRTFRDTLSLASDGTHPAHDTIVPFTIQPVLSKLDGEYAINVAIVAGRSWSDKKKSSLNQVAPSADTARYAWLIGVSTKMYSVSNTLLPSGYNFSITDESGNVLYDSRPGRALLSNFFKGSEDPSGLHESAVYRNRRLFNEFMLNGKKMALLETPMPGLPYTLFTYYNLEGRDEFESHLIGLSCFFTGVIILLILFSAMINEATRKKRGLTMAPASHFEWLQPVTCKEGYYKVLIRCMLALFSIYCLGWLLIEVSGQSDFALFFLNLLFPFNIAASYYSIRRAYYFSQDKQASNETERITIVMSYLLVVIVLILLFYFLDDPLWWPSVFLVLAQLLWGSVIGFFRYRFCWLGGEIRGQRGKFAYLNWYSVAIVCGVCMISLLPASGIFWVLSRQETTLRLDSERLETIRQADMRRDSINSYSALHKFFAPGPGSPNNTAPRYLLKFHHGIYLLHGDTLAETVPDSSGNTAQALSETYTRWHQVFFPSDSSVMAWNHTPLAATDLSWRFRDGRDGTGMTLTFAPHRDAVDPDSLRLFLGNESSRSSFSLMWSQTFSTGVAFVFFFFGAQLLSLLLSMMLTRSLAKRVFQLNLLFRQELDCQGEPEIPKHAPIRNSGPKTGYLPCPDELDLFQILKKNEETYRKKWEALPAMEKFLLYDFAKDGFTNYKAAWFIFKLRSAGHIILRENSLEFVDPAFHEFVLHQSGDKDVRTYLRIARQKSSWQSFKLPVMLLFGSFGLFIFFTQEDLYQKIAGLAASFVSIRPLLLSIFDKSSSSTDNNSKGKVDSGGKNDI
jgi:hypothetical protein